MRTAAFFLGLAFLCSTSAAVQVEWACRDRFLWIQVMSKEPVRFEAVDGDGAHAIGAAVASRCGYSIGASDAGGRTTFRASYYSCFTAIQDDKVFSFQFNVMAGDGASERTSRPVSAVCSGPSRLRREMVCEEDYMEVNVQREASCAARPGPAWEGAVSQALTTASRAARLMFRQGDGRLTSMSVAEAESGGYGLTLTAERAVLRAPYKAAEAQLTQVDGIPVVVVGAFLFYKRQLMVLTIDMTMACTVNSAFYDGARLVWDVPRVLRPLVEEGATFKSLQHSLKVGGVGLDEQSAAARGFSLVQQERLVQILIPFGAEGGYKKSSVVDNVYKETFVISLLYEHRFSAAYQDGSSVDTKLQILRVLQTPPLCRQPFSLNQTDSDEGLFRIYLGNIPSDVILEEVTVNRKQMLAEATEGGFVVSPVVHLNGSRAYELQLPFSDAVVHEKYMGDGVVQYSIDVNFTLSNTAQGVSYFHHVVITAQVLGAFPPKIAAQCSDRGMVFSAVMPPRAESLWEVGVDQEPLTPQLAAQRGYKLRNESQKITLEVPVFSAGFTYEDITLLNFYGTFKLLLRDSRTLEVQTTTSKRCRFKTEDMIVCSADGVITVVTTPASTWPTVRPDKTSLLDPSCRPKQTDATRVLFQFQLDSCGTRATVGDFVVYENEILHDRQLIADGPNLISRDSQFKLTVRCFYPLSGINRLTADRISRSESPGFGSIEVFGSLTDPKNMPHVRDCIEQVSSKERSPSETEQTRGTIKVATRPGPPSEPHVKSENQQTDVKVDEHVPTPPTLLPSPAQGQLEDGFSLIYNGGFRPSQGTNGLSLAKDLYDDGVARSDVTGLEDWSPLSHRDLIKPNEAHWLLKKGSAEVLGRFHMFAANQHKRPANAPHMDHSEKIPVPQNPNKVVRHNHSVNNVQNIRVKPLRRLVFQNPSQKSDHSTAVNGKRPEDARLRHWAETPNTWGGPSSSGVIQAAGPSRSRNGAELGGFLPQAPGWSDGVSSLGSPDLGDKEQSNARYKLMEGNLGPDGNVVKSRTSGQHDCHGLSDQYPASIHHGIVRAVEPFEGAGPRRPKLFSGGATARM
ncbi:uncharacterized protein LOC133496926 isoform X2 [Syngnathoides biaculeatus]|uniref:uncharacterized protein LOC133496926 isoform X2 n=1 Tax=Syngnathoides biaculeatus TaxID=300417 RepID=UPI002ADD8286|nr:uncharacterized protein LOC133496926 isoform X2 [Syngnathoides biaculeatus]